MNWTASNLAELKWSAPITHREEKEDVARRVAGMVSEDDVIGVGSGSTAFLAIQAIGRRMREEHIRCTAIPTSAEMAMACASLGISVTTLLQARPDWAFDGADEVNPQRWLIKGRGGALFQEKLIMASSPKNFILVDHSKLVEKLGSKFPVPVEVHQSAMRLAEAKLYQLGATSVSLRWAGGKDGPVITENGNLLLDVHFPEITAGLEREIKCIPGVIESGLFIGFDVDILVAGPGKP